MNFSKTDIKTIVRNIFFSTLVTALVAVISCVKVGPVPDFEYTYDFKGTLPDIDVNSLQAETVGITAGTVNNQAIIAFSTAISNPATAMSYAAATNAALSAAQKTFWSGKTQSTILSELQAGNATTITQVTSARSAFLSNGTLQGLVPTTTNATSSTARTSARTTEEESVEESDETARIGTITATQDEFSDCRQAAQDAFDVAVDAIDAQLILQLQQIQTQYDAQLPLIEAQRAGLEAAALTRHTTRVGDYLTLYNSIATTISTLFTNASISAAERDQLLLSNIVLYAICVQASFDLLNAELTLINTALAQATANLLTARDALVALANANYAAELQRLTSLRNSTQAACHNQGGVNVQ